MSDRQAILIRAAAVAIIVLAAGVYLYINSSAPLATTSPVTGFVSKIKPIVYDYNSQAGFYPGSQGCFYFYTKDSVSYRSSDGTTLWNDPFDISHPEAFGAGQYLALAELRGQSLRVYGPEGLKYSAAFDLPILNFSVNETGYGFVKLQNGKGYLTHIYDADGGLLQTRKNNEANMFPISVAISPSGQQLALSVLDITGVDIQSHILFAAAASGDDAWGAYKKPNQLTASLKFNGENSLLAASDAELTYYSILTDEHSATEGASVTLDNEIRGLGYMGEQGVVLAFGRGLPDREAVPENTVRFYNARLEPGGEFISPRPVTYLYADGNGAIIGAGNTYYGFNTKGGRLWQYNSAKELKQLIFLNATDTVLEVGYTEARLLKRERLVEPADDVSSAEEGV